MLFTVSQNLLYGTSIAAEKHISDSQMFKKLACVGDNKKIPVYGKSLKFNLKYSKQMSFS